MTVAGEQEGERIDPDLHTRNRRYWNGWAAQALSEEEKAKRIEDGRATESDLAPLTGEERAAIANAFANRCSDFEIPHPTERAAPVKTVHQAVFCNGFLFPCGADFAGATVSGDFIGATFSGVADFEGATFSKAEFAGATFSGKAEFANALLNCAVDFRGANFSDSANFQGTHFSGYADFRGASFFRAAGFEGATFSDMANFAGAGFVRDVTFEGATFSEMADFNDARFKSTTKFWPLREDGVTRRSVRFLREPPAFFGATLHQDTDFTDVDWPKVPDDADPGTRRERAIRHRSAYERLKLLMDSQKKVADELMFQRLELRCREAEAPDDWRHPEWWVALASRAFGALSEYGWNPVRPLAYLMGLVLVGWLLIFAAEMATYLWLDWPDPNRPPEYLGPGQAFALSLSNVFGFLGLNRTFLREEIATLTAVSEVVSAMQTLLGLVLVFLLGLALRNRFRIK